MALNHSPRVVTNGLSWYLDAANPRSYSGTGAVWSDLLGANDGSLNGSPTYSTEGGGSFIFASGSSQNTNCGTNLTFTANLSICMWVKPNTAWISFAVMIDKSVTGGAPQYRLQRYSTTNELEFFDGTNTVHGGNITTGTWNMVGASVGGGTCQLFINGDFVVNAACLSSLPVTANPTILGTYSGGPAGHYDGNIGLVKIYNRPLSNNEMQQNFDALRGRYGL